MAMRSPGPENCLSFDSHDEVAGTRMLPWTSEGQKGAVAVVGSLNMPRDPFLGEYEGPSVSTRQGYLQGSGSSFRRPSVPPPPRGVTAWPTSSRPNARPRLCWERTDLNNNLPGESRCWGVPGNCCCSSPEHFAWQSRRGHRAALPRGSCAGRPDTRSGLHSSRRV